MNIYCLRCKDYTESDNLAETTYKNGRRALKGSCSECGAGKSRILGNKEGDGLDGDGLFGAINMGVDLARYRSGPQTLKNALKYRTKNKGKFTDIFDPLGAMGKEAARKTANQDIKKIVQKQKVTPEGQRLLALLQQGGLPAVLSGGMKDLQTVLNR